MPNIGDVLTWNGYQYVPMPPLVGPRGKGGGCGPAGPPGPPGPAAVPDYGSFFALMPPNNAAPIAPGAAVEFPADAILSDSVAGIRRASTTEFILPTIGDYEITWQASVDEGALAAGAQLRLAVDTGGGPVELPPTTAGRDASLSQISNTVIIRTLVADELVSVVNPTGNAPITLTPFGGGGGATAVSAWLVIKRLSP